MLVLLAIISFLLALPFVQTKLGKSATSYLQKEFDVDINLEKVDLSILGNVHIKEVLIKDHHADTLIYVKNLESSLYSFTNIMNNKLEFGAISLDDFILNIKTYKDEEDDALTIFADKFDDGKIREQPSTFKLSSDEIELNNGFVEIIDDNKENNRPLFFKNIKGRGEDFIIQGPNVNVSIIDFSFIENNEVEAESFSSDFSYTMEAMKFLNTTLETATSTLLANITFTYNRENLSDFNNKVTIEATVEQADISLIDLQKFYEEIGSEGAIHFTTNLSGQLNNLDLKNLKLTNDKQAIIDGDINLKNSFNTENGFSLEADFNNLTSNYEHLKTLLPNLLGKTLPTEFKDLVILS